MNKFHYLVVLIFTSPISCFAAGMEEYNGYFLSKSQRCTIYEESIEKFIDCSNDSKDCLLIKKIDDANADIQIYSTQANQSGCAINLNGKLIDGKIILQFPQSRELHRNNFQKQASHSKKTRATARVAMNIVAYMQDGMV